MGGLNGFILICLISMLLVSVVPAISSAYSDTNGDVLDTYYQQQKEYQQQEDYYARHYYVQQYWESQYWETHFLIGGFIGSIILLRILWSLLQDES